MSVRRHIGLAIDALALFGLGGGAAATALGFAGDWWWIFDLLAHFRLQLGVGLVVCAVVLSARQRPISAAVAGVAAIANVLVVAPLWLSDPAPAAEGAEPIRLTLFNVNVGNRDHPGIAATLRASDADVIAVLEIDRPLLATLTAELAGYQVVAEPRADSFGIALFFRLPGSAAVIELVAGEVPAIAATLTAGGRSIDLLALHPLPPIGAAGTRRRDAMLRAAADWVDSRARPTVVIGDLNATPFSHGFRVLRGDRLTSSQDGFGFQASWAPLRLLAVPIDHCLHSRELTAIDRRIGAAGGSDHRPLHVTLAWRR